MRDAMDRHPLVPMCTLLEDWVPQYFKWVASDPDYLRHFVPFCLVVLTDGSADSLILLGSPPVGEGRL